MKRMTMVLGLALLLGSVGFQVAGADPTDREGDTAAVRVGTFDSRAVALAYYRSDANMNYVKELKAEHKAALAAGNEERAEELSAEGENAQHLAHKQGFGTWPVNDILARIEEEIPGIAAEAGVDVIVSKWDIVHVGPEVEFVDVTLLMVQPFNPDKATLKLVREELPKVDPVPLEELEKHDH
jgi:hypothetical protein